MTTITLKSIPPFLHAELKKRAQRNKRSLNNEILICLEAFLGFRKQTDNQFLNNIRAFRKTIKTPISNELIDELKNDGRP